VRRLINHREVRLFSPNHQAQMRPIGSAIFSELAWEEVARSLNLSGRQLQIVRGIFDDEKDFAIAHRLGISLSTVHTHIERLHHKLAITDRPQLLLRVMQEFLTLTASPGNGLPPLCATHASPGCPFSP
jgi:DNA-binding NarL/FixJ family response regulator